MIGRKVGKARDATTRAIGSSEASARRVASDGMKRMETTLVFGQQRRDLAVAVGEGERQVGGAGAVAQVRVALDGVDASSARR